MKNKYLIFFAFLFIFSNARAQHESLWEDAFGSCSAYIPGFFPWPTQAPNISTWTNPTLLGDAMIQSIEVGSGKTLIIKGGGQAYKFKAQSYAGTPDPKVRIIVRKGGHLIIDGATLTRCGTTGFWDGIEVEGDINLSQTSSNQGKVTIKNNAEISFAY